MPHGVDGEAQSIRAGGPAAARAAMTTAEMESSEARIAAANGSSLPLKW